MPQKKQKQILSMPTLVMRGLVMFPRMSVHFDVTLKNSINAITKAVDNDKYIFLVAQREENFSEIVTESELYKVGVIAKVIQSVKTSEDTSRILVEGIRKAKILDFYPVNFDDLDKLYYQSEVEPIDDKKLLIKDKERHQAIVRTAKNVFQSYALVFPNFPKRMSKRIDKTDDFTELFDEMLYTVQLAPEQKQEILEQQNPIKAFELLIKYTSKECKILDYQKTLFETTKERMDQNQRDYFLREQIKVLSQQLGEDDTQDEAMEFLAKLDSIGGIDDETYEKLEKECHKFYKMAPGSPESAILRNYLDTVLSLPWDKKTKDSIDLKRAVKVLDSEHFGLKDVKKRILEFMAVRKLSPDIKGQILCLVGPPGVGKSTIAKSVAKALGRKYVRVSLGGIRDEAEIRGHRKTYVGAMPGRITNAMIQAKVKNPLVLLDEIDKMSNDFRGDPSAAMLEVLDTEQNSTFRDHYTEVDFDLSEVMFITTANDMYSIPAPLLDRMEIIEIGSYTREEKFHIAKKHLVRKELKKNGLSAKTCAISNASIYTIIDNYTREAGVRKLERTLSSVMRKVAVEIVEGKADKVTITPKMLEQMLGPKKYIPEEIEKQAQVGIVNGLAWTAVGGELMQIEVAVLDGSGKVELTGSLGDVMKESAKAAITHVRSIAKKYDINPDFYKDKDIHIHVPEGAVPKDGPSAGLAITTAVVSALSGRKVRNDVAMTGEVTLRGRALAIGGLREKTMAAYRAGVKTVIIPKENKPDLYEVDDVVKNAIEFVPVESVEAVLKTALV